MRFSDHIIKTNSDKFILPILLYILIFLSAASSFAAAASDNDRTGFVFLTNGKSISGEIRENNDGTITINDKGILTTLLKTDLLKIIYDKKNTTLSSASVLGSDNQEKATLPYEGRKTKSGEGKGTINQHRKEKIDRIKDLAEQGDAQTQFNLGLSYLNGDGVQKNFTVALKWFKKAANQGLAQAQNTLGAFYADGQDIQQDFAEAAKWFRQAADQGLAGAQYNLGRLYGAGKGVQQNSAEAAKWLRKAAEQGYEEAQYMYGLSYANGIGVQQDIAEALKWFRKAADQGYAEAQYMLGLSYEEGEGVPQDFAEAAKWYRKAADQGYAEAQFKLGLLHGKGKGVQQDFAEAAKWFQKALEQGHAEAQYMYGLSYFRGEGVPQDYSEAAKWFQKAAEQGYAPAQNNLALLYLLGKGVPQDYAESTKWLRKAVEQGYAEAQYGLGYMYAGGGVHQDFAEAAKWYRKAADQGYIQAQFSLGGLYNEGKGVPQDYVEAAKWYRKAAEQGDKDAQYNLGLLYASGKGVQQDYAEAAIWYRKAAEQGHKIAKTLLDNIAQQIEQAKKDEATEKQSQSDIHGQGTDNIKPNVNSGDSLLLRRSWAVPKSNVNSGDSNIPKDETQLQESAESLTNNKNGDQVASSAASSNKPSQSDPTVEALYIFSLFLFSAAILFLLYSIVVKRNMLGWVQHTMLGLRNNMQHAAHRITNGVVGVVKLCLARIYSRIKNFQKIYTDFFNSTQVRILGHMKKSQEFFVKIQKHIERIHSFQKIFYCYMAVWIFAGFELHTGDFDIASTLGFLICGFSLGILIKHVLPSFQWKHILLVTLYWTLSKTVFIYIIGNWFIYSFFGLGNHKDIHHILSKSYDIAGFLSMVLAGLLIGKIIKTQFESFTMKKMAILGLGWAISDRLAWAITSAIGAKYDFGAMISYAIVGFSVISITYWRLGEFSKIKGIFYTAREEVRVIYCKECGKKIAATANFCTSCGTAQ